jgi:hypothetical protein
MKIETLRRTRLDEQEIKKFMKAAIETETGFDVGSLVLTHSEDDGVTAYADLVERKSKVKLSRKVYVNTFNGAELFAYQWNGVDCEPGRPDWLAGKVRADHNEQILHILGTSMIAGMGDWVCQGLKDQRIFVIAKDNFGVNFKEKE